MDGIWSTAAICAVLSVLCGLGVVSYVKKLKSGCCGAGGDTVRCVKPQDRNAAHYPHAVRVGIEGMHCKNCALRIENAFNAQADCMAEVHLSGKYAVVRGKKPLSAEEIKQTVWHAGYQVTAVETVK
ncbi:MAG: cation transporter [Hominenteromicrobium sp.]